MPLPPTEETRRMRHQGPRAMMCKHCTNCHASRAKRRLLPDHLREAEHLLCRLPVVAYQSAWRAGPSTERGPQQESRAETGWYIAHVTYDDLLWKHRGEPHRRTLVCYFNSAAVQTKTGPGGSRKDHVACPETSTPDTRTGTACRAEHLLEARLRRQKDLLNDSAFPREWEEGQWRLINGILPWPSRMPGTRTLPATTGNVDIQLRRCIFRTPDARSVWRTVERTTGHPGLSLAAEDVLREHAVRPTPAARSAMYAKRLRMRDMPEQTAAAQQLLAIAVLVARELFRYGGRAPRTRCRSAQRITDHWETYRQRHQMCTASRGKSA
ncbi:UNVERIFIED_CONTAM: hypothetical protein K2H54_054314 [Gekko kuhli]